MSNHSDEIFDDFLKPHVAYDFGWLFIFLFCLIMVLVLCEGLIRIIYTLKAILLCVIALVNAISNFGVVFQNRLQKKLLLYDDTEHEDDTDQDGILNNGSDYHAMMHNVTVLFLNDTYNHSFFHNDTDYVSAPNMGINFDTMAHDDTNHHNTFHHDSYDNFILSLHNDTYLRHNTTEANNNHRVGDQNKTLAVSLAAVFTIHGLGKNLYHVSFLFMDKALSSIFLHELYKCTSDVKMRQLKKTFIGLQVLLYLLLVGIFKSLDVLIDYLLTGEGSDILVHGSVRTASPFLLLLICLMTIADFYMGLKIVFALYKSNNFREEQQQRQGDTSGSSGKNKSNIIPLIVTIIVTQSLKSLAYVGRCIILIMFHHKLCDCLFAARDISERDVVNPIKFFIMFLECSEEKNRRELFLDYIEITYLGLIDYCFIFFRKICVRG